MRKVKKIAAVLLMVLLSLQSTVFAATTYYMDSWSNKPADFEDAIVGKSFADGNSGSPYYYSAWRIYSTRTNVVTSVVDNGGNKELQVEVSPYPTRPTEVATEDYQFVFDMNSLDNSAVTKIAFEMDFRIEGTDNADVTMIDGLISLTPAENNKYKLNVNYGEITEIEKGVNHNIKIVYEIVNDSTKKIISLVVDGKGYSHYADGGVLDTIDNSIVLHLNKRKPKWIIKYSNQITSGFKFFMDNVSYSTPDTVAVTAFSPENGTENVSESHKADISFNNDIDVKTMESGIVLKDKASSQILTDVKYSYNNKKVTLDCCEANTKYGHTYQLVATTELCDFFGRQLYNVDTVLSEYTVMPVPKYDFSEVKFYNGFDNTREEISKISTGLNIGEITYINNNAYSGKASLIGALMEQTDIGLKLIDIQHVTTTIKEGKSVTLTTGFNIEDDPDNYVIKMFTWDMKRLIPLGKFYVLDKDGIR